MSARPLRASLFSLALVAASHAAAQVAAPEAADDWTAIVPTQAEATEGVKLVALPDGSLRAEGENPNTCIYELAFVTELENVTALRVECLADESLADGGPGRARAGNIVLSEIELEAAPNNMFGKFEKVPLTQAFTDHAQAGHPATMAIDGDVGQDNGWAPEGQKYHDDCEIVVAPARPFGARGGTQLKLRLKFVSHFEQHSAGRIRVSLSRRGDLRALAPLEKPPETGEIERAQERGIAWLLRSQQPDGSWGGIDGTMNNGMTALGAYTLIQCGLPKDHPAIARAFAWIDNHPFERTYDVGCALMAYKVAGEPFPARVKELTRKLLDTIGNGKKDNPPTWGYPFDWSNTPGADHRDLSNTQYAVLGLRAAVAMGEKVPPQLFAKIADAVAKEQGDYGQFQYRPGERPSSSMTVAGMGILLMCREQLERNDGFANAAKRTEGPLQSAESWLRTNWSTEANLTIPRATDEGANRWYYYYLYGLERVGSIWNRRAVATHDWYAEVAQAIVKRQGDDGSWTTAYGENDVNTCFALLFLTRASRPTGAKARAQAKDPAAESAAFEVSFNRANPLVAWVGELHDAVLDRLTAGERVTRVEWRLNGADAGSIALPPNGNPRLERFTTSHALTSNGVVELSATMRFESPDGKDAGAEQSNPVRFMMDGVEEARDREGIRDAGKNVLARSGASADASSSYNGYPPSFALDGRGYTSWICAPADKAPWIRVVCRRPQGASVLKLTQAQRYPLNDNAWSRAKEIEVQINGNKPQRYVLLDDPMVKQHIVFKPQVVKGVKITVKSVYEGFDQPPFCGFKEIELIGTADDATREQSPFFGAVEDVVPLGAGAPQTWKYSTTKPPADWTRPEFDDSGWEQASTPFGGKDTRLRFNTAWNTDEIWLRRQFEVPKGTAGRYAAFYNADDLVEVFVNGIRVGGNSRFTNGKSSSFPLPPIAEASIHEGVNTLCVRAWSTGGAVYIDAGLARYLPAEPVR